MYGSTGGAAAGQAIFTDDVSLQVFMEHLKRLVSDVLGPWSAVCSYLYRLLVHRRTRVHGELCSFSFTSGFLVVLFVFLSIPLLSMNFKKMLQFAFFSFSLESEGLIRGWLNVGSMQRWKVCHTQLNSWVLVYKIWWMASILNPSWPNIFRSFWNPKDHLFMASIWQILHTQELHLTLWLFIALNWRFELFIIVATCWMHVSV